MSIKAVLRSTEVSSTIEDNCKLDWEWERGGKNYNGCLYTAVQKSTVLSQKGTFRLT